MMSDAPKISIVMPVYNVEPYLRECLNSVRAQTFTDWECICVDDGSTDSSPAILDEYAAKDSRFRVFRREHSNAGAVRNFGMTKATGDYLAFLDSDDVFSPRMFEILYGKANEVNADVIACSSIWFNNGTALPDFISNNLDQIKWQDKTPDIHWSNSPLSAGTMPWNKIIRREFVDGNDISFLEQTSTNDFTFMALVLAVSKRTLFTNEQLVGYRQRLGSIQAMKSKAPANFFRAVEAFSTTLANRGYWQSFSSLAKIQMFKTIAGSALWELSSQSSFSGYRDFYQNLKAYHNSFVAQWNNENFLSYAPRRYKDILEGGFKERFRAALEAVFAPVLCAYGRQTGIRLHLSKLLKRVLAIAFESPRLPWNRR